MQKVVRTACLATTLALLLAITAVSATPSTAAEKRVIMCGRSVMEGWFEHWGWDWDDSHTVSRSGYTLQHGKHLSGLGEMVGIFSEICDAVPAGTNPVMFFKFCFADFNEDNLDQLQNIANQVIQTAQNHGLRLIIGNALPVIEAETNPVIVSEHRAYNAWLVERAKQTSNVWIYDMYGVLSNSAGALKPEYQTGNSHPNDAGYNALDTTYFPFLDSVFGSAPPPPPQVKRSWYFAEGTTDYGFEEYLCIQNPTAYTATIDITYNTTNGPQNRQPLQVPARSRQTIRVNDEVKPTNVSTVVNSDKQIVAERAMYWDGRRGGHSSIGTASPAGSWFLAEGSTNWGFDTFILIQNPSTKPTTVNVNFLTTGGPIPMKPFTVAAGSRHTINARDEIGSRDFSTSVAATEPITCERSMYWNNETGKAGHDTIGVTKATYSNYLAEGCTNYGFDTYVLISNPNNEVNAVQVTYMTPNGIEPRVPITMEANTRFTVHVNEDLATARVPPTDVSIRVVGNYPVVAERAMYWQNKGGGHDSIGYMSNY